jgi:LmeA-like phospholipid-binding
VGALVLCGSLLGLDRTSAVVLEHVSAGKVQKCLQTADRPHVRISDFPLLPHLLSGRLHHLTLTAHGANAKGIRVADLQVDVHGVNRHGTGNAVSSLRGSGRVSYDAISAHALGLRVSYGGAGTIEIAGGIGLLSGSGTVTPHIDNGDLVLQAGALSSPLLGNVNLQNLPPIRMQLRQLPTGVNVTLNPTEQGLAFSFDGTNVTLPDNICDMS